MQFGNKLHCKMNYFDFKKNIYSLSAELGVPFGLLLSVEAMSALYADKIPILSILATFIMLAAPVVLFMWQRKRFVVSNGFATFTELWAMAIFTTLGGALIMALVTYLTLSFLRPTALYDQMKLLLDNNSIAFDKDTVKTFRKMIDKGLLPSPIDYSMMQFWLIASLGSVGGILTAFIARKIPIRKKDNNNN